MNADELLEKLQELPPEAQEEVTRFVDFLWRKHRAKSGREPAFSWRGALSHLRDQYTSVELQHRILELWTE